TATPYPPKWTIFPSYPLLAPQSQTSSAFENSIGPPWNYPSTDIRETWCWDAKVNGTAIPGCDRGVDYLACPPPGTSCSDNLGDRASRAPWDADPRTPFNTPTFTTRGNNANSAEAWLAPDTIELGVLTPGASHYQPVAADRNYTFPWTNAWYTSGCNRANVAA